MSDALPTTQGPAGRVAAAFINSKLTPLVVITSVLLGLFAIIMLPREEEPQIKVPMVDVMVAMPGFSAKEVEERATRPMEKLLWEVPGVEYVYSTSRPSESLVIVRFKVGSDVEESLVRLNQKLASNYDRIPHGVSAPLIKPRSIDDVPILALTFHSARYDHLTLRRVVSQADDVLKQVPQVAETTIIGGAKREIRILLDPAKLAARNLSPAGLVPMLQQGNRQYRSGGVTTNNQEVIVETGAFLTTAEEVGNVVVGVFGGKPVYLREVSTIEDGAEEPSQYVLHGDRSGEQAGVTLSLAKRPGANAIAIADEVLRKLETLKGSIIPSDITVSITRHYGETASEKSNELLFHMGLAVLSVSLLIMFTLGWRESIIVAVAVPSTLALTLLVFYLYGFTLNRITLFALIFSIGILVDDAIVVVENIHRHQQLDPHKPLLQIIPAAVDEVGGPTILATFTVIAALLPMAFVSGLMGPYMGPIPINSSLGMAISLAIAFSVTPWLAAHLMKSHGHSDGHAAPAGLAAKLPAFFTRILSPFLESAAKRWLLLAGILGALFLSVGLAVVQLVVLKMLPFDNKSEYQVIVEMPAGSALEDTAATLHDLGAYLAKQPEVQNLQGYAGTASPITFNGLVRQYYLRADAEQGDLQVNLVDKHHRSDKSHVIAQRHRPALEKIAAAHGARIQVVEVPPGPPVMSPLVAEVYGPDEAGRQRLAARVAAAFRATPDIVGIETTLEEDAPRAFLRVQRQRAESLGIPVAAVAQTVYGALSGLDAAYLHDGQSKYPVPVRLQLPREAQVGLDALLALPLRAANGQLVPLSELVRVEKGVIDKPLFTKDLHGVSYVFGDMAGRLDSPLYGLFAIRPKLKDAALPGTGEIAEFWIHQPGDPYRQYAIKWDGEWQITYETFRDMGAAYGVGLILIYLLVVAQFRNYLTPLIIMAPIPLTMIGVMPGHALLGSQFTATSMIGMIALAGIIVRNSILLVDFIELQVAQGMAFKQAVMNSAAVRAQPIALTGLAAMIGAFFILDDPIFNGLAIALIFGILVSTLLTLVVIPVLYFAVYRRRHPQGA